MTLILRKLFSRLQNEADAGDQGGSSGGSATTPQGDAGAEGASVLATAGEGAEASKTEVGQDEIFIPEKFRVFKEDNTLDIEASSRKLAQSYSALEKHKGYSEVPPDTVEGYTVNPPEAYKEVFDAEDPLLKSFLEDAHKAGMTQSQVDTALNKYFELLPSLVDAQEANTFETTKQEVEKMWPNEVERKQNMLEALNAAKIVANKAGLAFDDLEKSGLGNNPTFIKLMASINKEFKEDTSATAGTMVNHGGITSDAEYQSVIKSEAYLKASHPEHALAVQKAMAYRKKTHPEQENA